MRITLAHTLAAIALSAVASGCVSAGMAGQRMGMMHHGGMSMGPMVGCPGSDATADSRLASLRSSLHITSAQEPLWVAYADSYRRFASGMDMGSMGAMGSGEHPAHGSASLPERVHNHETMMSTRLASLHDLGATLSALYASMSAEQKAIADAMACDQHMRSRPQT